MGVPPGSDFAASPELAAIVRRYLAAYGENDIDTLLNLFSDSGAVLYQGTAEDELWDGATLRAIMPAYAETKPGFRCRDLEVQAFERGDTGFAAFRVEIEFETGKTAIVRGTHLYRLERGMWRLVHAHHSSPRPNAENMGYEAAGLEDLLAAAASQPTDLGQTGIASVMFTDIADSTTLAEAMGDAGWGSIVASHLDMVRKAVTQSGGTLVKTLGDGSMSSFPSASAALIAARSIQRSNAAREGEPRLRLRVGVHTGDVMETGGDFVGTVVNKAARVAAITGPGEICVSDATRAMVGGTRDFRFGDAITVPLKGLEGEHLLHRLEWRG